MLKKVTFCKHCKPEYTAGAGIFKQLQVSQGCRYQQERLLQSLCGGGFEDSSCQLLNSQFETHCLVSVANQQEMCSISEDLVRFRDLPSFQDMCWMM